MCQLHKKVNNAYFLFSEFWRVLFALVFSLFNPNKIRCHLPFFPSPIPEQDLLSSSRKESLTQKQQLRPTGCPEKDALTSRSKHGNLLELLLVLLELSLQWIEFFLNWQIISMSNLRKNKYFFLWIGTRPFCSCFSDALSRDQQWIRLELEK